MGLEMYSESVLYYYENPPNKRKLEKTTATCTLHNPLCGDEITVFLQVKAEKIEKASFEGNGCAISQAAASMLLESIEGKTLSGARKTGENEVLKLLGVCVSPAREKCAFLGLEALRKALR